VNSEKIRRARDLLTEILGAEAVRRAEDRDADADDPLMKAARRVVWERYKPGSDWDGLKNAIGELADIVGQPASEGEI
jgi:hypothetical protein